MTKSCACPDFDPSKLPPPPPSKDEDKPKPPSELDDTKEDAGQDDGYAGYGGYDSYDSYAGYDSYDSYGGDDATADAPAEPAKDEYKPPDNCTDGNATACNRSNGIWDFQYCFCTYAPVGRGKSFEWDEEDADDWWDQEQAPENNAKMTFSEFKEENPDLPDNWLELAADYDYQKKVNRRVGWTSVLGWWFFSFQMAVFEVIIDDNMTTENRTVNTRQEIAIKDFG